LTQVLKSLRFQPDTNFILFDNHLRKRLEFDFAEIPIIETILIAGENNLSRARRSSRIKDGMRTRHRQ